MKAGAYWGQIGFGGGFWGMKKAVYVYICLCRGLRNSLKNNNLFILQIVKKTDSIPPYSIRRAYAAFT